MRAVIATPASAVLLFHAPVASMFIMIRRDPTEFTTATATAFMVPKITKIA